METEIIIRLAVETDTVGIENVARCTWNTTYANIISPELQERLLGRNYAPDALVEAFSQKHSWFFVASAREEIIGYAQFVMREGEDRSAELSRIYVLPKWQREGIGALLLTKGLASLAQEGITHLFVVVEKDNPIGRRFYEKHGFCQVKEFTVELPEQNLSLVEYRLEEMQRTA